MGSAFHEILSQLRKNKRVSQRKVAADLCISQALLSHYENGIREPGLSFVSRACDYYGVSADYLLGRTGTPREALPSDVKQAAATQAIDAPALASLLQTVSAFHNTSLFNGVCRCLGAVSYRLLRHITQRLPAEDLERLCIPENRVGPLSEAEMHLAEAQFLAGLEEVLQKDQPADEGHSSLSPQLISLLSTLDEQIARHTQHLINTQ